jgi:hypothetical protein
MSTITTNTFQELATGDSVGAKYVVHGTAKAWARLSISGGTPSIVISTNVSSVTDKGVGQADLNLTNAFTAATSYSVSQANQYSNITTGTFHQIRHELSTASLVALEHFQSSALADPVAYNAHMFGDLA